MNGSVCGNAECSFGGTDEKYPKYGPRLEPVTSEIHSRNADRYTETYSRFPLIVIVCASISTFRTPAHNKNENRVLSVELSSGGRVFINETSCLAVKLRSVYPPQLLGRRGGLCMLHRCKHIWR